MSFPKPKATSNMKHPMESKPSTRYLFLGGFSCFGVVPSLFGAYPRELLHVPLVPKPYFAPPPAILDKELFCTRCSSTLHDRISPGARDFSVFLDAITRPPHSPGGLLPLFLARFGNGTVLSSLSGQNDFMCWSPAHAHAVVAWTTVSPRREIWRYRWKGDASPLETQATTRGPLHRPLRRSPGLQP